MFGWGKKKRNQESEPAKDDPQKKADTKGGASPLTLSVNDTNTDRDDVKTVTSKTSSSVEIKTLKAMLAERDEQMTVLQEQKSQELYCIGEQKQLSEQLKDKDSEDSLDAAKAEVACVHAHQEETDYVKKKHRERVTQDRVSRSPQTRKRGEELTEREQQLMEAIEDRTNEKSQLASEKYQLEEELDKTKHEVFALRHQVTTLEAEKRAKESSGDHSESEKKEVDYLKQKVSELEHHLAILQEHSKTQSRTVLKLKEEAFGVEMQEEQIQSYEGIIQELEERQDHLQKELSKVRSELEMVTKYKEKIENELKPLKEEAFRAEAENEELRAQIIKFSESLEAKNELQRKVYKLENEQESKNKELENHQATLASVEALILNQKLLKKLAQEETDSYWREEAAKLKSQLQEAEQHLTDLMSSQEDYPAKEAQVKQLMKSLEEKTTELDKMTKRVNKLEEDTTKKKKKKKGSDAAAPAPTRPPQESVDARKLARVEQLYNDASLELQEMHKELAKWLARYKQLENRNVELKVQVKAIMVEQDKQLLQKMATAPIDPSQVSYQFQMQPYDHGQTRDIQLDEFTMSQEEYHSGNLPHHVPASTIPSNQYPQGQVGGSVTDQLQFQQFLHPSGVIPGVVSQIQGEFEVQSLGQHQSSTSAKKSLFELEEKKKAVEIERQQKLAVLESEEKAVITKLIEDLELSHDRINHLDMVLVQRNKEITQLQNEVFLLHNDIEAKAKLEMDLKSTIALLNQKSLSAIESEKELEARMEVLETEKQKAISELESEKQSAAAAVQEITVSLEAEKHEKSNLQDALNKTLHQSEKMHKQSLAAIEHLQEQIKWLNKTLLLWHQTPHGHKTGDQLKHFVIQEDSEPFKYGAIVAAGCFGAVHSSTIGDIRCIAKRIHDILVGRGGQQGVSEKDKMAILANFKRECTILSTARHRNVVQFMGVHYGNEEYDISLIMEDLPTDLERFLSAYREENDHQDGFKLPLSFQVSFLSDIASGLLYLHSQSIVHRDLNSGNVLLTADLQAKIADLGVSKLHQDKKWFQKLTQAPGASGYMPPEAVAKKPVYDEKIDIFSFGVLSLYIATQNFPEILEEHVPDEIHHKGEGEIFKRQEWVDALKTQQHPFYDLVWQCLLDKQRRPQTTDVVEIVRRMREDHQCTIKETLNVFAHFHDLID